MKSFHIAIVNVTIIFVIGLRESFSGRLYYDPKVLVIVWLVHCMYVYNGTYLDEGYPGTDF